MAEKEILPPECYFLDYYERHMLNDRRKYDNLIKVIQTKNIPIPKEIEETRAYYSK